MASVGSAVAKSASPTPALARRRRSRFSSVQFSYLKAVTLAVGVCATEAHSVRTNLYTM